MPESAGGLAGCDLATGPTNDMSPAAQDALQQLETHLDGFEQGSGFTEYLSAVDLLNDQDAITALLEDHDFLSRTIADFKDWQASKAERGGQCPD